MRNLMVTCVTLLILSAPAAFAGSEHAGHDTKSAAHEEVIDGVKATFTVQTMKEALKAMGMEMPKGVKETHHISLTLKDIKSGKAMAAGEAKLKVQGPDKVEQTRDLLAMHGHFGADVVMEKKGKYGVMCKFKTSDGKVRQARFWYEVK